MAENQFPTFDPKNEGGRQGRKWLPFVPASLITWFLFVLIFVVEGPGLFSQRQEVSQQVTDLEILQETNQVGKSGELEPEDSAYILRNQVRTWPIVHEEDFSESTGWWELGNRENDYLIESKTFSQGKYKWQVEALQPFSTWVVAPLGNILGEQERGFKDFYLRVQMRMVAGPRDATYGVIFRYDGTWNQDDDSYYQMAINDEQFLYFNPKYDGIWRASPDRDFISTINPNENNTLEVIGIGWHFYIFINNKYAGDYWGTRMETGRVGLTVSLTQVGDKAVFEFDNFEFRSPGPNQ
ncbi:MAG: hypothetical protein DWQ07_07255 [Chloroflexi bacterium]|nr:MAG: hypothetical protein DWQ07_07255 [Chloroflexota bacterium]MBL1195502.1 hypothetical protein [Chloroflexota bacterium]NOH12784.1 hypothetical protein [Chloroflexota bacterium]